MTRGDDGERQPVEKDRLVPEEAAGSQAHPEPCSLVPLMQIPEPATSGSEPGNTCWHPASCSPLPGGGAWPCGLTAGEGGAPLGIHS